MRLVCLLFNHLSELPAGKQVPESFERQFIVYFPSELVHIILVIISVVPMMNQASEGFSCHKLLKEVLTLCIPAEEAKAQRS